MRVIWVSPAVPHPQQAGGWAHEFEMINALASRHDIHVVSSDLGGPFDEGALLEAGAGFTRVPWRFRPHPQTQLGVAVGLIRANPSLVIWLRRDRLRTLAAAIRELSAVSKPDVIHITLSELAPLLGMVEGPTGLLMFDSLTREIEGRLEIGPLPRRRAQMRLERWRTRRFERKWYPQATGLASVSTVDADWCARVVGRPAQVIENSVPDRLFEPSDRPRSSTTVTFVGTLYHHPNTDAIEWLARDIWPLVLARRPDARLRVIGRGDAEGATTAKVRATVEAAGGRVETDVDDIQPYYWEAAVVVVPIRLGGGMRSKVIHAMACRAPVVATPAALEGVPDDAIRHVGVGSTDREIADAVVAALDDRVGAAARAEAAAAAIDRLRVSVVAARLEEWWTGLATPSVTAR